MFSRIINHIIVVVFIDNPWLKKVVHCHQLSARSFFWKGRQFHICARCTGILVGIVISPLTIIHSGFVSDFFSFLIFPISILMLGIDGFTQLWKWRESNNKLRFVTGFIFGFTFLPFILQVLGYLVRG